MMRRLPRPCLLLAAIFGLTACSATPPLAPPAVVVDVLEAPIPSSSAPAGLPTFRSIYENVLSKRCANASCHGGSFEPYLGSASGAYDSLVNAPASGRPHAARVVAGDPAKSYLIERLTLEAPQPRMPFNLKPLPDETTAQIRDWIAAGALFEPGGEAPALPNFPGEPPTVAVYRGDVRIDEVPPATVRIGETLTFWAIPHDFESAESCTLPHQGVACVPWVNVAIIDASSTEETGLRGLCVESPWDPTIQTPYRHLQWDAIGQPLPSGGRIPAWGGEVVLPTEGTFAPILEGYRCDLSRGETRALAGMRLTLFPVYPEDSSDHPRYIDHKQDSHLVVERAP